MQTMKTTWEGIRPLVLHNGILADPTHPIVRSIKELTSKKKKSDADHERIARLEWEGSLYLGNKGQLVIPSDNLERAIQLGAQKNKLGKDVAAAVFCQEAEVNIEYKGPKSLDAMYNDPAFVLRKGVKVGAARVMRVRPMLPVGWRLSFVLEFDETIISESNLAKAMIEAGTLVGLGDWRPKFGRFLVK